MAKKNNIYEEVFGKGATPAPDAKTPKATASQSVYDQVFGGSAEEREAEAHDIYNGIIARSDAYQYALAKRDIATAKGKAEEKLNESPIFNKPYPTSEDVQRGQLQGFLNQRAEVARNQGAKRYLDSTIGQWGAERVSSVVGDLTTADAERMRSSAAQLSQLKAENGELPKVDATKITRSVVTPQLPQSVTEAKIQIDNGKVAGEGKVSFAGLADRSKEEASKIVADYIEENPHMAENVEVLENYVANSIYAPVYSWHVKNDEKFYADAFKAATGMEYADYLRQRVPEVKRLIVKLRDEAGDVASQEAKNRAINDLMAGGQDLRIPAFEGWIGETIAEKPYDDMLEQIEAWEKNNFTSSFGNTFDLASLLSGGLFDFINEAHLNNILARASRGEKLYGNDARLYELYKIQQDMESVRKYIYEPQGLWSHIGEGVGTTVNMLPEFAVSMYLTGGVGSFAKMGTMTELKAALKVGGKDLMKYGARALRNVGLAKGRGLISAPFMPMTYNTYFEALNSGYKFNEDGTLVYTPVDKTQAYFGSMFSTANEISSEYLGIGIGSVVSWGGTKLGKMIAKTRVGGIVASGVRKGRKYIPKLSPQAKVAMRTFGVQADPVSETLSEALGDIMTSYEQSMIGMEVDMGRYGTFDYWMTLAGVTLVYGGAMATLGSAKSYNDVKNAIKERDAILGKISNRNLYNTLLAVSTSDDVVLASAALEDFDWAGNGIKPEDEDRRLADAYVVADLNVKVMQGMVEEETRLGQFSAALESMRGIVYQESAGEPSDKIYEAEMDGKPVYVINGLEEGNTTGLVVVVDPATGERITVDKSKITPTRQYTVDEYIREMYSKAFSLEEETKRVEDIKAKAMEMESPTEEDVARVASTLNISLPKVGDAVMLANGNMGAVTERLSPTEYAVQGMTGATYKVHFTDILSTDKLTATAQGALARGEVSTPMTSVPQENAVTEATVDENGITMGSEVTVDGRVGKVRARTENGDYVVSFEDENGNYENAEVEVYTPTEMASLMGVAPMPSATTEGTPTTTEVATTEDGSVDIEQMSAEDAAKVLVERAGTIEEAIAQVKQVIETVTEERKKMVKAEKKASLNDVGKKSAELQALDTRLEFYGEVLGVLEGMLAEQQKQTMKEAQNIAEEAGVATTTTEETTNEGNERSAETPTSGLIRNGAEMKFTDNVIRMVDFIAQRLGVTVEFVDDLKNEAGQPINGDIKGKHVRISTKGDRGVKFIVGHEFFHRIKDNVDEATYNKYIGALKEFFGEELWEKALNAQKRKYRAHNVAVAKKSMEEMTPEEVAAIAEQLGVNIEGLSAEDAKDAVARAAMRKAEQGDKVARALFPTMLTYSDELMLEETAADISGEMVANLDAFSNFVEDNKSEYAIIRGMHKALRYIHDMFATFGQTTRQRKVKRLVKNLEDIMAEAVKNERKGAKKAREDAKEKGVQESGKARSSLIGEVGAEALDMAEEATTRLDNLAVAREMETAGKDAKAIRMATGWERGADGLWRYEIMDAEVNLYDGDENTIRKKIEVAEEEEKDFMQQSKTDTKELRERTNTYLAEMREKYGVAEGEETDAMTEEEIAQLQSLTNKEIEFEDYKERRRYELYKRRMALEAQLGYVRVKNSETPAEIATTRLGHILQGNDAEMLFTAYPSLRDIEVQFVTDIRDGAFAAYATKGGYKRIELNAKKTPADMIAPYILHEVQHAIQDIEGFAGGGNLSSLQSDENVTAEEAYDYYRKIAGEVEARNVSARINMTPEERRATLLSETEDVAREDQIFLREGAEMAMAQPKFSLSEETTQIFDAAKAKFGTTYDMREAGYILPDGSMLDFSGRHQVEGDASFLNGDRTVDHREISDIAYDAEDNETGINTDLGDFLDRGAIRIDSNAGAINLNVAPTKAQKDRLKRLIERNDGYVYIDFGKGWDTEHYAEYEAARASRVLGDIDRYFDEGIKPAGNVKFSLPVVQGVYDALKEYEATSDIETFVNKVRDVNDNIALGHPYLTNAILDYYEDGEDEFVRQVRMIVGDYDGGGYAPYTAGGTKFSLQVSAEELAEIEAERKSIIETAKANGTYLKAPNGKDTNLTPEQWVDVRTSRFKKWFGDWELAALWEQVQNLKTIFIPSANLTINDAEEIYNHIGVVENVTDGRKVHFVHGTYGKIVRHKGYDTKQLIPLIAEVFQTSIPIGFEKEIKKEGHKDHSSNFVGYHHYLGKINSEEGEYYVRFTVQQIKTNPSKKKKEGFTPNQLHSTFVSDIEIYSTDNRVVSGNSPATANDDAINLDTKLETFLNNAKSAYENVSKIVDENGEPKIVHHGTQTKFDTFDIKYFGKTDFGDSGKGFYFKDNPSGYGGAQNIDMQVFLNIKNPYIVYKYSAENNLGGLYKTSIFGRTKQQLKEDIKNGLKNEEDYNEALIDEALSIIDTLSNEEISFINSHDGVIALTKEGYVVEYVTSNSNQIKSATDNVGTYDANNPDTRFSLITPEMDASYLDAVNRGDMEAAQRMVVEAAKLAMPNTKVVDEDGNPKVVYHGTPNNFNAFSKEMFGTSTDRGIWGNGFYFSDSEQYAKTYEKRGDKQGRTLTVFLNIENPLFISLRNGGNEGAMYFHELMEKHFTDDIYEDATRIDELMSVAQERLTADIVAKGYDGIVVEYTNHIDTEYVAFEPNQIKSADPVTYDDNGNVIPLSERFNPENKDIRYSISSEEDILFEKKTAFLTDLVREYNIPLPTFIAQTKAEFKRMALEYGIPEKDIDEDEGKGCYCEDDNIILINGGLMSKPSEMNGTLLHEHGHYITISYLSDRVEELANRLNPEDIEVTRQEVYGKGYSDKNASEIINELVSFMVGRLQKEEAIAIFEGQISIQEFIDKWIQDINGNARSESTKATLYEILPLVKDNIELQKKQYGAERASTIVIPRREYVQADGRGYTKTTLYGGQEHRSIEAQPRDATPDRRGEGADAQEVTRFMLPDPDPSEVFYDDIPIFDEQGNEIDFNTLNPEEAKAILDSKVRQMLEAEYEHNISAIRKEAREARQAIIDRYNEEKGKRKKNNKPSRTNAARIDDILGDKPFESLPLEDQALILIATGRAKIRWGDNGTQRGLASELGLTGSKGDKHAYRSIWSGATKSFSEVVHDWWESIGGQERGIDDQDLRNALIEAFQSVQSSKDAMGEIMRKYDDLSAERDAALAEVDRMEEKDLREAKTAYEQHSANFELSEGEERASYHDRAAQFFGNQNLSRTDEILEDLVSEMERQKRKIERLKAENKDVYAPLAEGIQKSKDIILHALERLRMFAGMEEVDLNDVARLINLVKAARSQSQVENLSKQVTALVQRVSIKKAKANLYRLLSLKLSNTDIIQQMLKTTNAWTDKERESVLKHLWKVSRNGLRVSKAVHPDTKNIFEVLNGLVKQYKKADDAKRKEIIEEMEDRLNPNAATIDMESKYQDYADTNKRVAYHLFKAYLEMLDSEIAYKAASSEVSKARESNAGKSAFAAVVEDKHVKGEEFLQKLLLFNQELENLIVKGKDDINAFYTNREEHAKEIRRMGIDAIGGKRARLLPDVNPKGKSKVSKALQKANAVKNATVNAPYWTLDTVLDKIDKAGKDGVFYKYFMDKFTDSNDAFIQRQRDHAMRLAEAMREFFPKIARFKSAYSLFTTIMHKADGTMLGEVRYLNDDRKIETIRPTISSAMYILAMWRQPRYKAGMEARGITQETIDSLYKQIKDVDEGYIKFMDWINDTFLPDTRLEYDVVHRALYGGSMAKEVNYFPANVLHYEEVKLDDNTGLGNISLSPSALKERTTSIAMPNLTMNYFKVLQAHLQNMDQWASFEELRIDLSTLLSSKEFKNRLMEMQPGMKADGSGAGGLFENLFTTSKIATGLYQTDYNTLLKAISYPQKKWVAANIAYRFWTGLKQLSSIPIFAFYQSTDHMSYAFFGKALARGLNPFHAVNRAMNLSPSLRYRWESRFAGLDVLMRATSQEKGVAVYRGLGRKTLGVIEEFVDVITRFGMGANAAMDVMACAVGVNMIYDYEIYKATKGKREATEAEKRDAIRKAEYAFNSTQQSSEGAYMSAMQMEPALSIYTAYKNASMAAHRKRSSGLEELWRLTTSKKHIEFLREELGEDGVSKRVDTAVSDIMQGFISDVGFAFMGTAGGILMFSLLFGWDDDDWDEYWQSFVKDAALSMLNGYAFGGLAGEALGSGKVTFNPALDELRQSVANVLDDKGDTKMEVADLFFQFNMGVDLKTFYNIAAGLENIFEEEDGNFSGAFLKVLNAPQGYLKAFVGDRREGESLMEYQTRIVRLNTIFDEVKYEDYFDEKGTYVGEGIPPIAMSLKQIQELRTEYEKAYRSDVLHNVGGEASYESYMHTEAGYLAACSLLGWEAGKYPNQEALQAGSEMHAYLYGDAYLASEMEKLRANFIGSEEDYFNLLMEEQKAKNDLINNYYEYIKQSRSWAH